MVDRLNGIFKRLFWLLVGSTHLTYTLILALLLSVQNTEEAHKFVASILPNVSEPLPEKFYAEDCRLYTPGEDEGPFHVLMDKMDIFVPAHFFGWIVKALIIRNYSLLMIISVGFELLEYTLEPQLPNFGECWWDHWILDVLLCNGIGIWCGIQLLGFLKLKKYDWFKLWRYPAERFSSLYCLVCTCFLVIFWLLAELNVFYMKTILWIAPNHWTITSRHVLYGLSGFCAVQELYKHLDINYRKTDYNNHTGKTARSQYIKIGNFVWLILSSLLCEFLVVVKFGSHILTIPLSTYAYTSWATGLTLFLLWILWKFAFHSNQ